MNNIFTSKNIKIFLIVLILVSVSLLGYYGYNEYSYQKIITYVAEGKYDLAENIIVTVSPNYRDLRKIKSLIATIRTVEAGDAGDMERVYSRLESFKGFENENVNQVYNTLLFSLYKDLYVGDFYPTSVLVTENSANELTDISTETTQIHTSETSIAQQTETLISAQTEALTTTITSTAGTTYTTSASSAFVPTTTQTTTYVQTTTEQYIPPATVIVTTTEEPTTRSTTLPYYSTDTVYYVESGEVYHINPECRTLARSTNIFSGPIPEGRRACKVCSQ